MESMTQQRVSTTTFTLPDQPDIVYDVARGPDPENGLPANWINITPLHVSEIDDEGNPLINGAPIGFAGP